VTARQDWREVVLGRLCVQLGLCLTPDAQARLTTKSFDSPESFADQVFRAEGLDPVLADPVLYRQVCDVIAESSPTWQPPSERTDARAKTLKRSRRR
jgi:hypothetical protein